MQADFCAPCLAIRADLNRDWRADHLKLLSSFRSFNHAKHRAMDCAECGAGWSVVQDPYTKEVLWRVMRAPGQR